MQKAALTTLEDFYAIAQRVSLDCIILLLIISVRKWCVLMVGHAGTYEEDSFVTADLDMKVGTFLFVCLSACL